jgi:hypothetical protein
VKHLIGPPDTFRSLNIEFVSLQEQFDPSTPIGRAIFTIIGAMTELERDINLSTIDLARLERDARACLSDFQGLLTRQVLHTRQLLQQLLVGRIVFRPTEGLTYEFVGQASFGGVLVGVICPKAGVAPRGHATSVVLARLYVLLQAYATLRFRPVSRWALKPASLR